MPLKTWRLAGTTALFGAATCLFVWSLLANWPDDWTATRLPPSRDRRQPATTTSRLPPITSHHLENTCKYPVLQPTDVNIAKWLTHPRKLVCAKIQPEFSYMDSRGMLYFQDDASYAKLPAPPRCYYRAITGTLKPKITEVGWIGEWQELTKDAPVLVENDQIVVECFNDSSKNASGGDLVHRAAYATIPERRTTGFTASDQNRLSLDVIVIDSTSLNQFKRHMPVSWRYMVEEMGFEWLEGYNKVADNSMVNLMPILANLRYCNQSKTLISDLLPTSYLKEQLQLEPIDFLWKEMQAAGCATMWNDDVGHETRGLFHYPWKQVKGWSAPPTSFYFRPWHVYTYKHIKRNSSKHCAGNHPWNAQQLRLTEQFMRVFASTCHFSFTFLTDLTHDKTERLELLDDDLKLTLERLFLGQRLKQSVVAILGDHGNRISTVRYSYVGRVEERMPLFALFLPPWLRRQRPQLVANLRNNRRRLTSNHDVYQTLKDVVSGRWQRQPGAAVQGKGLSLFAPIPADRSCEQANIPEHHCTCLEKRRDIRKDNNQTRNATECVRRWLSDHVTCWKNSTTMLLLTSESFTISQMVRHGLRNQDEDGLKLLQARAAMEIVYVELTLRVPSLGNATFITRIQNNLEKRTFLLNVDPLIQESNCPAKQLSDLCHCA